MKKIKAVDVIQKVVRQLDKRNPSLDQMLADLRLMKLNIKPIRGDIESLSIIYVHFIRSVWNMGRIDSIVGKYFNSLEPEEKNIVMAFLDDLEEQQSEEMVPSSQKLSDSQLNQVNGLALEVYRATQGSSKTYVN
ncbi:MAG: hypothetical protein ACMG6E_00775 [Candidatus Roizmanbacteria bacterium]